MSEQSHFYSAIFLSDWSECFQSDNKNNLEFLLLMAAFITPEYKMKRQFRFEQCANCYGKYNSVFQNFLVFSGHPLQLQNNLSAASGKPQGNLRTYFRPFWSNIMRTYRQPQNLKVLLWISGQPETTLGTLGELKSNLRLISVQPWGKLQTI